MMQHIFDPLTQTCAGCGARGSAVADNMVPEQCQPGAPIRRIEIGPAGTFYSESPRNASPQFKGPA